MMPAAAVTLGRRRDAAIPHRADAVDRAHDLLADGEVAARIARGADAGGRAGEDQVTGLEGAEAREVGDELPDAKDHVAGAAALHALARHVASECQVVR